jgi:hypothetical protein
LVTATDFSAGDLVPPHTKCCWNWCVGARKWDAKETVRVPESVLKNTASHTDFAGLLSDVLEEVLAMTEENSQEKAEALAELLRPLVPH